MLLQVPSSYVIVSFPKLVPRLPFLASITDPTHLILVLSHIVVREGLCIFIALGHWSVLVYFGQVEFRHVLLAYLLFKGHASVYRLLSPVFEDLGLILIPQVVFACPLRIPILACFAVEKIECVLLLAVGLSNTIVQYLDPTPRADACSYGLWECTLHRLHDTPYTGDECVAEGRIVGRGLGHASVGTSGRARHIV